MAIQNSRESAQPGLTINWFSDDDQYRLYQQDHEHDLAAQRDRENAIAQQGSKICIRGRCLVCNREEQFEADWLYSYEVDGELTPNWRERLVCSGCGLNNRMRAAIFVFRAMVSLKPQTTVFLSEQLTPVFRWFEKNVGGSVGSEYLGTGFVPGTVDESGIRHEDLTDLSLDSASVGAVVSLDVLEHIPNYSKALREIRRVLMPGGFLLLSVPLILTRRDHLLRARVAEDGSIIHLEEPEYHGDPIRSEGCLAFHHFGWSILDDLRDVGFVDVGLVHYWSEWLGFLGADQTLILARTPDQLS